jgi:uncharacterized protein YndB with AHSA1/START domain
MRVFLGSLVLIVPCLLGLAPPAAAEVGVGPGGFSVLHKVTVPAPPAAVWEALVHPERWWSAENSWSGRAENLFLDATAGGCFCETLDGGGVVEHMRVVHAAPGKQLRLVGALGPLQAEAVTGTLTWTLRPVSSGTEIVHDYVVGGYMRFPIDGMAQAVDAVQKIQTDRLAALLSR